MRNLECEKRVMLNFEQYQHLLAEYMAKDPHFSYLEIENIYLDDDKGNIHRNHNVLRIRKTNGKNEELTLKIKGNNGDIEINETLSSHPEIDKELNISFTNFHKVTSLRTNRLEAHIKDYLVVIDQNIYNGIIDYDLEVEASSIQIAEKVILEICQKHNIEYKKEYLSKSARAFNSIKDK